ncbi:MAG: hypothetical protein ACI9GM_001136 [Salibacteraceae bacterium]|jgi:hypothetical protein
MAKTMISVLTQEKWLEDQLCFCIDKSNFCLGIHSNQQQVILDFITNNTMADHILLVKPSS